MRSPPESSKPVVSAAAPEFAAAAEALAARLQLVFAPDGVAGGLPALCLGREGLALALPGLRPFRIDYSGQLARRARQPGREQLVRAMGRGARRGLRLVDATAGLGRDAFLLAAAGFDVTLLERSPALHAMLEDGLQRAGADPRLAPVIARMDLRQASAADFLRTDPGPVAIVYLDPMFPEQKRSAAAGRESQVLQALAGGADDGTDGLLALALERAERRVVVKRHRNGPWLSGLEPDYQLSGSSTRFDIYLAGPGD